MPTDTATRSFEPADHQAFRAAGWWDDRTLADHLVAHAATRPDAPAYLTEHRTWTWAEVADAVRLLAAALADAGVAPGDRVGVWLPDSPAVHVAFLAVEAAGATIVGLGARSGPRELAHVLAQAGATRLVTLDDTAAPAAAGTVAALRDAGLDLARVTVDPDVTTVTVAGQPGAGRRLDEDERRARRLGPDELYLVNSTSGTTGLPKCVRHTQNRWTYFHRQAVANGRLGPDDVFLGLVPAPFGFGLWTSHVTPVILGAPTILFERFDAAASLAAVERFGATVLCCVSTQFIMMLAAPGFDDHDLSSLRVMFTGGEAVPYERALRFEQRTGATTLQFYGSNETGLLSGTTLDEPLEVRLRTAGRIVPEMQVRLFDGDRDVTATGRGQPGCRGPALSLGYLDGAADRALYTPDGWMLMGDICELDDDGYLRVVGRTSDFIIRGGKNISAAQVESDAATHPAVAHAAAVAVPDPTFGERVCLFVELAAGTALDLDGLRAHLAAAGIGKETFPERLVVVDQLPRSSGGKVAKGDLRRAAREMVEAERAEG